MVRPRGLEPPLVAQLAPQASASTNSATAAEFAERQKRFDCLSIPSIFAHAGNPAHPQTGSGSISQDQIVTSLHPLSRRFRTSKERWCGREDSNLHWLPN